MSFLCRAAAVTAVVLCACSCAAGDHTAETASGFARGKLATATAVGVAGEHPLGLADAEFWGDYTRTQDATLSRLERTEFRGLLIDLPRTVGLDEHDTLPLVGLYVRTFRQDMQRDLEGQAVVVAVDLRTGELHAAPALDPGKHRSPPASTGDPDPGEGIRSEMFETDLHRVFDLPWRPGGYAVAVILQDWISNVVTTELAGGAVAGNAGTARPTTVWPPAARAGDVPDYRRRPDSPEVPDGVGIALAAPTTVHAGGPLIIRGSFRLPLSAGEQLAAGDRPGTAGPRGVLPIALIATGTEDPGPFPVALRVPVDAVDRDLAIGHFAVDLVALRGVPRVAAVYYVHALSVGVAAPPVRISVVSP